MKKFILTLILALFLPVSGWSATYYVCQSGKGNGSGDSYTNCKSVANHNSSQFFPGDVIYLCDTITTRVIPPSSGSSGSNITYRGDYTGHPGSIDGVNVGSGSGGAFYLNGKNYISLGFGLTIENTTQSTSEGHGLRIINSNYITVDGCTIQYNGFGGIYISNSSSNWIVQNSTIQYNTRNGLLSDDNAPAGGIIRWNLFNANGQSTDTNYCQANNDGYSYFHNIYIGSTTSSETQIYENKIINDACGQGIKLKAAGRIYRNYIEGNEDYGIFLIGHPNKNGQTINQYVYENIIKDHRWRGIAYWNEGEETETLNIYIYNNTIYQPEGTNVVISIGGGPPAPDYLVLKNNILYTDTSNYCVRIPSGSVPSRYDINNNWCYTSASYKYFWNGSTYTLSTWRSSLGNDINGDAVDPKFKNAPSDLTLASDSPCIDKGLNVGVTYGVGLDSNASWPYSVTKLDQDNYGTGWEIGAYVYKNGGEAGPSPPTDLRINE